MRTLNILIVSIFIATSGFGQVFKEAMEADNLDLLAGKTYAIISSQDTAIYKKDSATIFEIIEPKLVPIKKTININNGEPRIRRVKTVDAHTKIIEYNLRCVHDSILYFAFAILEVPAQYRAVPLDSSESFTYTFDSIMSGPKLYSFKVDNAPQKLDSNQFFLPAGIHSSLREYTYSCCGGTKNLVEQVQKALNTNGYSIIEDNTLDEATRNALIDYQKKNDLPVGNLNVETLKHLGIKGY